MNLLVIPSGTEIGLEIHDALWRRRDMRLFGAESTDNSHASFVFARNSHVLHFDEPGFIDSVNRRVRDWHIDLIFPAHDDVQIALASAVGQLGCGLVSSPVETLEVTRFKSRTYDVLRDVVDVPRVFRPEDVVAGDFPVFVKPDRGQGSQRTQRCDDETQLLAALEKGADMLVCEHLPGTELTVDCFSDRDRGLLMVSPRRRTRVRAGISVRSEAFECPVATDIANAIGSRLGLHGAWFFQIKQRADGGWSLLEVGARIPGGATYQRQRGINLCLLNVFEHLRKPIEILPQPFEVVMDRAYVSRFHAAIEITALYVDFDDTLCLDGSPNAELVSLLVVARHRGRPVVVLTRNDGDCHEWLAASGIRALVDDVICMDRLDRKSRHMVPGGVLVDDSFAERKECAAAGRTCVDLDAVPMLIRQLQLEED